jgi:hypothetical protein
MTKQIQTKNPPKTVSDSVAGGKPSQEQIQEESGARPVGENEAANEPENARSVPEDQESGGATGQNRIRGQGGDRSQSGGPRDYGGGYGAGGGQLPYGYESGPTPR